MIRPERIDKLGGLHAARRLFKSENHRWPMIPVEVPRDEWPDTCRRMDAESDEPPRLSVWRSRDHLVQVFDESDRMPGLVRISVNRTDIDHRGGWKDGIAWDDLQRIKRFVGYGDRDAVEVYPPDRYVINRANIRHLWVLPGALPWRWT